MNADTTIIEMEERKVRFSTLWIFAMFNYIYADVMGLYDPGLIEDIGTGEGAIQITEGFLLGGAILMETAIAMVLLSRLLKYGANRWANIIVGVIHTLAVFGSMFVNPPPTLYYLFFGTIEIACTLFIIWYAWTWRKPEGGSPAGEG